MRDQGALGYRVGREQTRRGLGFSMKKRILIRSCGPSSLTLEVRSKDRGSPAVGQTGQASCSRSDGGSPGALVFLLHPAAQAGLAGISAPGAAHSLSLKPRQKVSPRSTPL